MMSDKYTHDDLRAISKEQGLGLRISDSEDIDSVIQRVYDAQQAQQAKKATSNKKGVAIVNSNFPAGKTPPEAPTCYGKYKKKSADCIKCWYSHNCKG
jgi:hypothetical protein